MLYNAAGARAIAATQSPLIVSGGTTVRPRICTLRMATSGTPTSDQAVQAQLRRATTAGTGTSVTPAPTDPGAPAALSTSLQNLTVEPTYSGVLSDFYFNPRATIQWAAYDPRAELIVPATANNGIGFQCIAVGGAAGNLAAEIGFYE